MNNKSNTNYRDSNPARPGRDPTTSKPYRKPQDFQTIQPKKNEIDRILTVLGIEQSRGGIIQANRRKALVFLRELNHGDVRKTCNRLSLRLNITPRRAREVYFRPFVSEGIIEIVDLEKLRNAKWKWAGIKGG